ncbi:MAG: DUF1059 domain-containing protein [Gaiellaceae bacterium]
MCECGFDARAADEEGLVAEVRRHAVEAHCMPLSHDADRRTTTPGPLCRSLRVNPRRLLAGVRLGCCKCGAAILRAWPARTSGVRRPRRRRVVPRLSSNSAPS